MDNILEVKRDLLLKVLAAYKRVAVAYSGGVDSAVVAKAAAIACGENAVAVTAVSPSLASGELELAQQTAKAIGIRHHVIMTSEFLSEDYIKNAGDRCFYCKDELYSQLGSQLEEFNVDVICNGANLDDRGDHRPGMKAAKEHRVRSPLIEAKLTKADVRALAQHWELDVWDKPAMPCLSSRIAYGVQVTPERVARVDAAEAFLKREFHLTILRVRCEENERARIEVPVDRIPELTEPKQSSRIVNEFKRLGFRSITIDLEGFRSGNLNDSLPIVPLGSFLK